ncbi:hypothetical protein ACQJBY_012285 [Aegilops geniculata]
MLRHPSFREVLGYMHSQMYTQVIHGDIKPANILLDDELRAKISDFGISRLVNTENTLYTLNVIGSIGYMDPLFAQNGRLTAKSDVYSFGVVLLELITRKKARTEDGEIGLVESFIRSLSKGFRRVREMFDPEIATSSDMKTIEEIAKLAGKCLRMQHDKRPEMLEVAERLRKLRKVAHQVQEKTTLFPWGRKNKLALAETPSLESSSSSQNRRTVAPAEKTPSQESSGSTPKSGIVAQAKVAQPQKNSRTQKPGTFIVRSTVKGQSFEMEDLLRGSAEVLGKGTVGTTYKASLESGYELVVKRLSGVELPNAEFEQHITLIGAIQDKHIVPLQWYYCSTDEKMLVYDIIPMGSLAKALDGKRGSGRAPLDWEQRSAISLAAARGVAAIHLVGPTSCHGNIKSSNILLTGTHDACVSEHGLITLGVYSNASGYCAPEVTDNRSVSQKADVYSFGILLLELLTCKAPTNSRRYLEGVDLLQWVCSVVREEWTAEVFDVELIRWEQKDGEEECMARLLQLAINCCSQDANSRPTMPKVVQQIEEIGRESKLAPGKTPSLESSSSCQNVRTVAPTEKTPSQESSGSTPKTRIVAPAKPLSHLSMSSQESSGSTPKTRIVAPAKALSHLIIQNVGTSIIRSAMTGQWFDLKDLLGASTEVLGKGTVGTTYRATLDSGYELVVKRLKDVDLGEAIFGRLVMLFGTIQNKHVAPLLWYYCSKDEKLLIYNVIPLGSLAKALHGDQGSGPAPLDWEQRLAISLAAAHGVQAIHLAGPSSCHGNIKSSNILLTGTHDACVSEHGLITLGIYSNASGYRAPEVTRNRWVSQESDVYSFGILLLELLTRKSPLEKRFQDDGGVDLPRWVRSIIPEEWTAEVFDVELLARGQKDGKEECMVQLMQLGLKCCSQDADSRPTMSDVVQRIEEIGQS